MDFDNEAGELQRKIAQCLEGVARRKSMLESLALESGQDILDLGCGGGQLTRELGLAVGPDGRVVGVDPSVSQVTAARELCKTLDNVRFTQDSATELSFENDTFDTVTSTQVLEYVSDVDKAISEIRRVLKKSGRFCSISVLWDHWRFYGPDPTLNDKIHEVFRAHCFHQMLPMELPQKLKNSGFSVINVTPIGFINQTLHQNSFALWASKLISIFALNNGMTRSDVEQWQEQLEAANHEGRFGFMSVPVLTTSIAV
ncbi:MAG: hypothetical protein CL402_08130 [Acidiferrobacteraceae bacterium]|nr:hypothetical protein [Acidiferrobacteraceae bacterium]|tara:strand:- start:13531 stop:14301 length:771 start_codon:yes stop_codon:yes gene_type:complete